MANFKNKRPRKSRAGCAMCKPQKKLGNTMKLELGHKGFGKLAKERAREWDLKQSRKAK